VRLADALRRARDRGDPIVAPYLMVDRGRRATFAATVDALRQGGATALELGFPFSDPIADGPILETAHADALDHGTRWSDLLEATRTASRSLPVAVMTYANPIVRRGIEPALAGLSEAGATGLIVPDLSLEESPPYRAAARRHGLSLVLLAAPGVGPDRVRRIARASSGFLYLVGHYGTTGGASRGARVDLRPIVRAARAAAPGLPVLVGFGVKDPSSARRALASGADGVIVGTALEERLRRRENPVGLAHWVQAIARASRSRSRPNGSR